ncbi:uncharacterized protein LOC112568349 isoform X2 [Pomacea canaliculata]|uniref:uncharacterized protein LOC112568349 isoform X2 n=1 Tax=Pomacea canaliculata TaxID=400727 RepID=UPI000D72E80F|nr:uncharacterized protein LOC112568349 isoform X2 [Pomacea canaliculata]
MRLAVKLRMICVLPWFYLSPGQTAGDMSTCNATAAELTTEATVTCLFPVDIRRSLLGFRVEHYKRDLNEIVNVADCMWTNGILDCTMPSGYKVGNSTSESFQLRIPHFHVNHTGDYWCDLDNHFNKSCTLHQLAGTTGSQESTIIVSAVVTPAAVLLIIIIIVIVIIAVTQYRRRKKRHRNNSRTPGHDDNDIPNTDQREELIDQRQECGSDNKLQSITSMATISCEPYSGRLTACEEQQQQTPLVNTNEISSKSLTRESTHADIITAVTTLCSSVVKQNTATRISCQLDADGSIKLVYETGLPGVNPEQEPVSVGQLQTQSASPCKILAVHQEQTSLSPDTTWSVDNEQSEEKTSIAVQEEITSIVHMRNLDPHTYEYPLEEDSSLEQTCKLKMLSMSDDNSLTKPLHLYSS